MPPLSVHLFGKLSVLYDDQVMDGLEASKIQELFCYLLLYRNVPHPRESLAALLWGDSSTAQSKKYLRQALWQLQASLEVHKSRPLERVLRVEPDWISLNPTAEIWLDVAVFEQAFALAREVSGQHFDPALAETLDGAVQLYQGDLLEGWYQDWCLCERERLQSNYLIMLNKMMGYCEAHHKYETGLTYGLRVLRFDRARESTHRRLMRLYYLAGDRTAALRQYEQCMAALAEELDVKPAKRTVALYDKIRADEFESVAPPAEPKPASEAGEVPLPEIIDRLKQLRAALTELQRQLQQDIQAVDLVLNGRR